MKKIAILATFVLTSSPALAGMSLVSSAQPAGSTSLYNAIGTFNFGNQKARLEAAGQATVQGGNPGNGWWSGGVVRSWDVSWNNTTGTVVFKVYSSSDWTGAAAMSMTQTPVFTAGNALVGLDIGGRLTSTSMSLTLGSVALDDGSGFVSVPAANASYSGNQFFNNYFAINGTLGDFVLRGTAAFPTGTTTGDSMRFFVNGIQGEPLAAIPAPGAVLLGLIGLGGIGSLRRRFF